MDNIAALTPPPARPQASVDSVRSTPWPCVAQSAALAAALDEVDQAAVLMDSEGRLVHANRAAYAWNRCVHPWLTEDGRVHLPTSQARQDLAQALLLARRGRRSLVTLCWQQVTRCLAVLPLQGMRGTDSGLVLLLLGRVDLCPTLTLELVGHTWGLTASELRVLRALCTDLQPAVVARRFGVSITTVRSQISSIRAKTGTQSIRELLCLVSQLPPMAPVLAAA